MSSDSYIVRIYRRAGENNDLTDVSQSADEITGSIQNVKDKLWRPFHNKDELWRIIIGKNFFNKAPDENE